ncbi:hypothetical protein STANM309S_03453 [Streptomyces tanashiensis]
MAIRLSTSTTWSVTSLASALRSSSFPAPASSARTESYRSCGTLSTICEVRYVSSIRSVDSFSTCPPASVATRRAATSAFAASFTSTESSAVRMTCFWAGAFVGGFAAADAVGGSLGPRVPGPVGGCARRHAPLAVGCRVRGARAAGQDQ